MMGNNRPVGIIKLDGGYLLSCGNAMAVRQDIKSCISLLIKWLDDPPSEGIKGKLADLFGYKTDDPPKGESPDWVDEIIGK